MTDSEAGLNLLDLCSGGGGFHLAAESAGLEFDKVYYSDINEYANKIYKARFPKAIAVGDLRKIRRADYPKGRWVVTAGFPCQPFSVAGSGLGINDDRYLWHEVLRIVDEFRPDFFIFENVAGIESVAFAASEARLAVRRYQRNKIYDDFEALYARQEELQLARCCKDLENIGAKFQVFDIPAIGVNAWHRRRRIWIVGTFADAELQRLAYGQNAVGRREKPISKKGSLRYQLGSNGQQVASDTSDAKPASLGKGKDLENRQIVGRSSRTSSNDHTRRREKQCESEQVETENAGDKPFVSKNIADDQSIGQEKPCLAKSFFVRQTSGSDARSQWQRHWLETAAELCRSDDGLSAELDIARLRNDIAGRYPDASEKDIERAIEKLEVSYRRQRIELLGNSIVPQIPAEIFRIYKQIFEGK